MRARFGAATLEREDSNGLGDMDVWILRFSCGLEAILLFMRDFEPARGLEPRPEGRRGVEVYASEVDRAHLQHHLGGDAWSPFLPDRLLDGPQSWWVRRGDDNGNVFDVASFSHRCGADALAEQLTARGHKQVYWVEYVP